MKIGVIAEAKNDVEVLYEFTCKLTDENSFSFKTFIALGCGNLRRKCAAWAQNLFKRGCMHLIVLHDLDDKKEDDLRNQLTDCVSRIGFSGYVVLIPIREIESWLLTDPRALKTVFGMSSLPKIPRQPESILDPKKKLSEIVKKCVKKYYVNTIHNKKIAAAMRISKASVCSSFKPYPLFVRRYIK